MRVIFDAAGCAEVRRIPVDYPVELGRFLKMRETRFEVSGGQVGLRRSGLKQIVTGEKELRSSLQLDPKRRETPKHEVTPSHRGGVGDARGINRKQKRNSGREVQELVMIESRPRFRSRLRGKHEMVQQFPLDLAGWNDSIQIK
ncbi:hypothetical protein BDW60DRAFT_99765 [Aspergillus nidulans var. acristatus]